MNINWLLVVGVSMTTGIIAAMIDLHPCVAGLLSAGIITTIHGLAAAMKEGKG
jgi:hypothetical protein